MMPSGSKPPAAAPPAPADDKRPLHVKLVKGRWYWDPPDRLRKSHKLKTHSLGGDQSNAWALARTLNRDHLGLGPADAPIGSVAWVLEAFLESDKAKRLAPSTRKDYTWLARKVLQPLSLARGELGRLQATTLKPRHADAVYEQIEQERGHATAHYACRFARRVWHWAARREMVDHANPWSGMELRGIAPRTALWTADQVAVVVAKATEQGRPSLGLATLLAYWFGHRQADVLKLTWHTLAGGRADTSKTKVTLPIDAHAYPELDQALQAAKQQMQEAAKTGEDGKKILSTHVLVHEGTRRPYSPDTFRHDWRDVANAAGIPAALQFRDLRATAMTELNDAGADVIAMSTHSGHKTVQMARRYARPTQPQFQNAAAARLAHRNKP